MAFHAVASEGARTGVVAKPVGHTVAELTGGINRRDREAEAQMNHDAEEAGPVLVAVGSSFVILGTGRNRVRFSVVLGTSWLWYRISGCNRDCFPIPPNTEYFPLWYITI